MKLASVCDVYVQLITWEQSLQRVVVFFTVKMALFLATALPMVPIRIFFFKF